MPTIIIQVIMSILLEEYYEFVLKSPKQDEDFESKQKLIEKENR